MTLEIRHRTVREGQRSVFAARAHARLMEAAGWHVLRSPRSEARGHAPLKCCFILRAGAEEQAAFGFTGLVAPQDADDPGLRRAQDWVAEFLGRLGQANGLLVQNTPLFSFGRRRRDRVAVFGGWWLDDGRWAPFFLDPGGLKQIAAQAVLQAGGLDPQTIADVHGQRSDRVLPRIAQLAAAIERLNGATRPQDGAAARPRKVVTHSSGWSMFETAAAAPPEPARVTPMPAARKERFMDLMWQPDEFRFRAVGGGRS